MDRFAYRFVTSTNTPQGLYYVFMLAKCFDLQRIIRLTLYRKALSEEQKGSLLALLQVF